MTIKELMYRKTKGLDPKYIIELDINENEQPNIGEAYHIYLKSNPQIISIISNILTKNINGISIYVDDFPIEFINQLQNLFNNSEHHKKVNGLTVQHIKHVGYIISSVDVFTSDMVMVNEYTLSDYLQELDKFIIVAIAKQEKHYIKDWVAYHLRIGFDKIYLYDNNSIDGEKYDELLSEYVNSGKLQIIDLRGKIGLQNAMYNASYYSLPFKWIAIIDIDEFIWFNESGKYCDIKSFLDPIWNDTNNINIHGVMLQWHCYAPSGDDKPSDKPIWEANTKLLPFNARKDCRCEYIHGWCKSIYKSGYRITLNEHFAWAPDDSCCKQVDWQNQTINKTMLIYINENDFINQGVFVKHFLMRNIDDFYRNKYMRGHAGADFGVGVDGWKFYQWRQNMNYFTDSAGVITEKEQIYMAKKGMKMNYEFHPDLFINWFKIKGNDYINSGINKIIHETILPKSNTFLTRIHMYLDDNKIIKQPKQNNDLDQQSDYDLSFLSSDFYNYYYMDILMNDESHKVRKFIQEPIVINIGIPDEFISKEVSFEEQKHYMDVLFCLFNPYNLKNFLRAALEHDITVIPTIGICDNNYTSNEELNEFLSDNGLIMPNKVLFNNTMIMPYSQFIKYKKYQDEFIKRFGYIHNNQIYDDMISNTQDIYQYFNQSVLSIIEKPYYVWPA